MNRLVVDSSSLISLSSNCLLWVLDKLVETTDTRFVITSEVRKEVVDRALKINKFRLGGIRVQKRLGAGILTVEKTDPVMASKILDVANHVYSIKGSPYKIVHKGEMDLIPLISNGVMVIDERIVEKLLTDPLRLKQIFENRLHMPVTLNKDRLQEFKSLTKGISVLKSSDIVAIAFEKGLMKDYIKETYSKKTMKDLLSGALWALKTSGCSISTSDIGDYTSLLKV